MFNLLVRFDGWSLPTGTMGVDRVFECTDQGLASAFRKKNGSLDTAELQKHPALFMSETGGLGPQSARVGTITRIRESQTEIGLEFSFDAEIPPIPNKVIKALAPQLGITSSWEFNRTHWAVKDADLFQILWRQSATKSPESWFGSEPHLEQDDSLVAVMMPFDKTFDIVYKTIRSAAKRAGMKCKRADNIWEHDVVIRDVVSLIRKARVVVCDCTDRNANVFYEAGIAHAFGRDLVLLAQSHDDVPFDLKPVRYLHYANDAKGRRRLSAKLKDRLITLTRKTN